MKQPKVVAILPARIHSTRFPKKVTHPILKKPMIQYVYENAKKASLINEVLIATEDDEVVECARSFNAPVFKTPSFESGSDRAAFVAQNIACDYVVIIQADEPTLQSFDIDSLVRALKNNDHWEMATLMVKKEDAKDFNNPHTVKVVFSKTCEALYFSRQPIGYENAFYKHVGIYGFKKEALIRFSKLSPSALEKKEKLEQLRALENGFTIGMIEIERDTVSVDVPSDILKAEKMIETLQEKELL